jgi:hypothetical protein
VTRRLEDGERALRPALLAYLSTGDSRQKDLDVALFHGLLLRFSIGGAAGERYRSAFDELAGLWRDHEAQIRAAAKGEPWCAKWLRAHAR